MDARIFVYFYILLLLSVGRHAKILIQKRRHAHTDTLLQIYTYITLLLLITCLLPGVEDELSMSTDSVVPLDVVNEPYPVFPEDPDTVFCRSANKASARKTLIIIIVYI